MKTENPGFSVKRRVSPGGMIDLPFETRKALGFVKGEPRYLHISVSKDTVHIKPCEKGDANAVKASPRGLLKLPAEAHAALTQGKKGRYRLDAGEQGVLQLQPARD
jgi:hypothetical protein